MKDDKDLIEQMVQDTFNLVDGAQDINSGELTLSYNRAKFCYSLEVDGLYLEIPENWGPFKDHVENIILFSMENDEYLFLEVINNALQTRWSNLTLKLQTNEEKRNAA